MLFSASSLRYPLMVLAMAVYGVSQATATTLEIGDQKGNARAILDASGALDGANYKIDWHEFDSAAPLLEALRGGSLDGGGVGNAPLTFAIAAGLKAKVLSADVSNSLAIVVEKGSSITSVSQLKGKKVASAKGSVGHLVLLSELRRAGLKPSDVEFVNLTPDASAMALANGDVAAVGSWQPYVSFATTRQGGRVLARESSWSYFVASNRALGDPSRLNALKDYAQRLDRARQWGVDHPKAYADAYARVTGVPQDVAEDNVTTSKIHPVAVDASVVKAQQQVIDLYYHSGLISKPLKAAPFFLATSQEEH